MAAHLVKANYQPGAWRVKDAAGEWVLFAKESAALSYKAQTGGAMQPLYTGAALVEESACDCGAYCDECKCRAVR